MDITSLIFKLGIATWCTDIITLFPATALPNNTPIGKQLPSDVGFIYGINTYADGTKDADGNTLPTTVQAQNIFITLQTGGTQFMSQIRLSDFLNEELIGASFQIRNDIFRPVNIPAFDLSKSFYQNPTSIVNVAVRLKLWYIQVDDWTEAKKYMKAELDVNKHFHAKK